MLFQGVFGMHKQFHFPLLLRFLKVFLRFCLFFFFFLVNIKRIPLWFLRNPMIKKVQGKK